MKIIGSETILERLGSLAFEGRLSPSYLFVGPKGVGKFLCAQWFAASVLCQKHTPSGPCGQCSACKRIESGNHPDISVLTNSSRSTIGIDDIREGIDSVQTCSFEGGYRFWIIDEAQRLTEEAQNALLKTLEEPPPSLVIILIAQPGGSLLTTVVSRCRRFDFKPLPVMPLHQELISRGFSSDKALAAAKISEGSLGGALELLSDSLLWDYRVALLEILASLTREEPDLWKALSAAISLEKFCGGSSAKDKEMLSKTFSMASSFYRDLLLLKVGAPQYMLVNEDYLEILDKIAESGNEASFRKALENISQAKFQADHNVNVKLLLQNLCLSLQSV
ncbi:MAG: DNA polymerase III subunit delta' [Candidatus Bruticola sp.]